MTRQLGTTTALALAMALAAATAACDRGNAKNGNAQNASAPHAAAGGDATNTGINQRDRSDAAKTPTAQAESAGDRDLTARIRQELTSDDSLSMNAHNVKIITENGHVTLRGPVDSEAEKAKVAAAAQKVAPGNVSVELDVASR